MSTIDRILELVDESGLTAKEYAINAGLGAGNITDWKTGRSKPSVESLQKIAKYANVQLEWLTGDSEFKTYQKAIENYFELQYKIDLNKAIIQYYKQCIFVMSSKKLDELQKILLLPIDSDKNSSQIGVQLNTFLESFPTRKRIKVKTCISNILNYLSDCATDRDRYYQFNKILEYLDSNEEKNKKYTNDAQFYNVPVYGQISAGLPNWAEECLEGYLPIDPNLMNIISPEECFFLKVNGESMNKVIRNGAYALIRKQDIVENGDIAAVLVNGNDATIKKFTRQNELVILEPMSDDDSFKLQIYDKNTSIKILGKYIGKFEINN